jgi:hypothetical protein
VGAVEAAAREPVVEGGHRTLRAPRAIRRVAVVATTRRASETAGVLAVVVAVLGSWSCGRTIEEEEPREVVEHRIEPCRKFCAAMLSPECGRVDEPLPFASVEECTEDCAALDSDYNWDWVPQADGTDACAEEVIVAHECIGALTCEEQRAYFRRPGTADEYPCRAEVHAKQDCYEEEDD